MKRSKLAIANNLSNEQEEILCRIQRATIEKDVVFVKMLPVEVSDIANKAQAEYRKSGVTEKAISLDKELCELVKKYWAKNGIAINQ